MGAEFIWIFLVCISACLAESCKRDTRCRISRTHGMKGANCFNQDIRSIPQCVASDVQIFELTKNRIRKLDKNDLKRYTSLKMLYLSDNMISTIHNDAFEDFDDLTTIDLSLNGLSSVPPVIFQLPSLKTLYLGHNMNINIADTVDQLKSISSPLVTLDLSYISDMDMEAVFPDLGIMPSLIKYNISGTAFETMSPSQFAGLCHLKYLVNDNTTTNFVEACDCWKINGWLLQRKVQFTPFACGLEVERCGTEISPEDLKTFEECNKLVSAIETNIKINKGLIYAGIVAGIFVLCILLYIIYQKTNRIKPNKPQKNTDLLL